MKITDFEIPNQGWIDTYLKTPGNHNAKLQAVVHETIRHVISYLEYNDYCYHNHYNGMINCKMCKLIEDTLKQ